VNPASVTVVKEGRNNEVLFWYTASGNRATNTPVLVQVAKEEKTTKVNQRLLKDRKPLSLGVFEFEAGEAGYVEVTNEGTDGHVVVDAVQLVPVK
jgi:hypothetical protein